MGLFIDLEGMAGVARSFGMRESRVEDGQLVLSREGQEETVREESLLAAGFQFYAAKLGDEWATPDAHCPHCGWRGRRRLLDPVFDGEHRIGIACPGCGVQDTTYYDETGKLPRPVAEVA